MADQLYITVPAEKQSALRLVLMAVNIMLMPLIVAKLHLHLIVPQLIIKTVYMDVLLHPAEVPARLRSVLLIH